MNILINDNIKLPPVNPVRPVSPVKRDVPSASHPSPRSRQLPSVKNVLSTSEQQAINKSFNIKNNQHQALFNCADANLFLGNKIDFRA